MASGLKPQEASGRLIIFQVNLFIPTNFLSNDCLPVFIVHVEGKNSIIRLRMHLHLKIKFNCCYN
jgi:hypothetical protein